jgi:hypothetical protein
MNRRSFLGACTAGGFSIVHGAEAKLDVSAFDKARVMRNAQKHLGGKPSTVTSAKSARSTGGVHDFFSEGDYWWPDPKNPNGPYIRRDGESNPDNFDAHRSALMRLSVQMPALAAAYKLSKDKRYADSAAAHVRAWFVEPATRMNPSLQYAQAIHGITPGRGTGVIDTIHLIEVARSIPLLAQAGSLSPKDHDATLKWFAEYIQWMTTSENGMEERDAKQNHAVCWLAQVGAFATLTENSEVLKFVASRFKNVIVPKQIEPDGSLPLELARTKPYGYCLFNLEALTTVCQIISEKTENLWTFQTADGRGVRKAIEFMYPFMLNKKTWKKEPDVMYFNEWPRRQESLLFGGLAYQKPEYLELWKKLPADSDVEEVIRNFFIRQPVLWVS